MNVAILGYGTVGKSVVEIINRNFDDINIKYVLVKSLDEGNLEVLTDNYDNIINDDSVDVVLEMINGDNPTYSFITRALKAGKHVISSNKLTIATHLEEYSRLAKENNVQLRYEASVGGGIPNIQGIIKAGRIDYLTSIQGIMNGTGNYILDHVKKDKEDFEVVLQKAIDLGYAEKDPTADIGGYDVQRKIMISSSLAYRGICDLDSVWVTGIENVSLDIINCLDELGYNVKLIGSSIRKDNKYYMSVEPTAYNKESTIANVNENYNLVQIIGDTIGTLEFFGQGAGGDPTANAMVQDLLDIKDNRVDNIVFDTKLEVSKELDNSYYIVFTTALEVFKDVVLEQNDMYIKTKKISSKVKEELAILAKQIDGKFFYVRIEGE
jgi:homoserine dehydrogenase